MNMDLILWFLGGFGAGILTGIGSLIIYGRKQIKAALQEFKK